MGQAGNEPQNAMGQTDSGIQGNAMKQIDSGIQGNAMKQIDSGMQGNAMKQIDSGMQENAMGQADIALYKKDFSRLGLYSFIGALIITLVQVVVLTVCEKCMPELMKNGNVSLIVSMLPVYLVGMPLWILLLSKLPGIEPQKHPMKWWQFLATLPMSYLIMIASNLVGLVITGIIGSVKGAEVENVMLDVVTSISPWVRLVVMVICAPIFEELIFRKMLVSRTLKYGQGVAIVLSGLMFGLFHGNLNQFAYAFCLGMFFAFIYVKTGTIQITIAMHMFINFMGGVIGGWLLELIDYGEMTKLITSGADQTELMEFVMNHLVGFTMYGIYGLLVIVMMVAGLVLFIVGFKRFTFEKGQVQLPKGQRFRIILLNTGMILFCLYWIVTIILQLVI